MSADELIASLIKGETPDLLILPGGYSRQMAQELIHRNNGKKVIQDYVAAGGKLLGICGGASLSCCTSSYLKDSPLEIDENSKDRLELLPVDAIGPFLAPPGYSGSYGYGIEPISDEKGLLSDNNSYAYYTGGCSFRLREGSCVSVLAHLKRFLPGALQGHQFPSAAVIQGSYGMGSVMLWAIHPETTLERIQKNLKDLRFQINQMGEEKIIGNVPQNQPASQFLVRAQLASVSPDNLYTWQPHPTPGLFDAYMSHFTGITPVTPRVSHAINPIGFE